MKHLIIFTHPNPNSLNALFKQTLADHLSEQGHEVEIRDLYEINFNPVLSPEDMAGQRRGEVSPDVRSEQEWILWADSLIVIHPIWWTGAPALFKGYIERVFSYGFCLPLRPRRSERIACR
jgi:NAD(P)H dehydrogenase (quinone)